MSGITGIYAYGAGAADQSDVQRMTNAVAHRGPDAHGIWTNGRAALGHRMLWTTRESIDETLPFVSADGNFAITADARIDNRQELLDLIRPLSCPASEVADSQLILAAYKEWGEACADRLLGDFAFAIWDSPAQALFCARDHSGVKPFYYHRSESRFAFASEIKALLCLPEVPRRLNEDRVGDFLTSMFEDTASTFYQGVFQLPPAHSMTITPEKLRVTRYWSLNPRREIRMASDEEYAEGLRELFTRAVHSRLRSASPIGSMLSGGLDSSSITCVARRLLAQEDGGPLKTFSAVFDDVAQCDERVFIDAVLAQNSVEPRYIHGDRLSPFGDFDRVLWHLDEPQMSANLFLNWGLYRKGQEAGVRVLLDGFDGDTTLSHGTGLLIELALMGRWVALAREAGGYARHFNLSPVSVTWSWIWHYRVRHHVPRRAVNAWSRLTRRGLARNGWDVDLNPRFVERIGLAERRRELRQPQPQSERESHYLRLNSGVMTHILGEDDGAAAAFAIEKRFPFQDKRLMEYCLALPPEQKLNGGWNRMVMRRAMDNILPKDVQWRGGKTDLSPNFEHCLRTYGRARTEDVVLNDGDPVHEYVNAERLRESYRRLRCERATNDDVLAIWKAVSLGHWLRQARMSP